MRRVLAAGVLVLGAACSDGEAELATGSTAVREAKVTRGEVKERVLLTGELRAGNSTELSVPQTEAWELSIRWMAEDGTLVKAGDKLLEFDNSAFTNGLEQKRIAVVEAASAFQSLQDISAIAMAVKDHELQQHRIALEKATLLASVPADLLPQRTAQDRQLAKTRAEVAVAKAQKDLAAEKQAAALELKVKQIELEKARRAIESAQKAIAELVLTAPRDGLMLVGDHPWEGRRFQVGDMVQPGFKLITLPDLSAPMEVRAELSDVDDGHVTAGMKGTCTLDAYPREPLPCEVTEVAPVASNRNRQSARRSFGVTLGLPQSDRDRMRPGMSVRVELFGAPAQALVVPRGAVVHGTPPKVRLASGEHREVTLGSCDAQRCAIDKGVAEGEAVAIDGGHR